MNKICTKCKKDKFLKEFNKRNSSKDGYAHQCRECNSNNLKNHYKNNKEKYLHKNRKRRRLLSDWFLDFKKSLMCIKCGESRWWVLEFHHRNPEEKEGHVFNMLCKSKKHFEEELSKCDVLCANCHKDVHYKMKNT